MRGQRGKNDLETWYHGCREDRDGGRRSPGRRHVRRRSFLFQPVDTWFSSVTWGKLLQSLCVLVSEKHTLHAQPTSLWKSRSLHIAAFVPMARLRRSLPKDLLWLQEDAAPTVGELGTSCPRSSPSRKTVRSWEMETQLPVPLNRTTLTACVTGSQSSPGTRSPRCPHESSVHQAPAFFPFHPPLTSPPLLPVMASQINCLHSNPASGSAAGAAKLKQIPYL